jgi:hypothetical protein
MKEAQLDIHMPLDKRTQNLLEEEADTNKDLHKELSHKFQDDMQVMKALMEAIQRYVQTQLKQVEVRAIV